MHKRHFSLCNSMRLPNIGLLLLASRVAIAILERSLVATWPAFMTYAVHRSLIGCNVTCIDDVNNYCFCNWSLAKGICLLVEITSCIGYAIIGLRLHWSIACMWLEECKYVISVDDIVADTLEELVALYTTRVLPSRVKIVSHCSKLQIKQIPILVFNLQIFRFKYIL